MIADALERISNRRSPNHVSLEVGDFHIHMTPEGREIIPSNLIFERMNPYAICSVDSHHFSAAYCQEQPDMTLADTRKLLKGEVAQSCVNFIRGSLGLPWKYQTPYEFYQEVSRWA